MPKSGYLLKSKRTMLGARLKRYLWCHATVGIWDQYPLYVKWANSLYFAWLWSWNQSLEREIQKAILETGIGGLDRNIGPLSFQSWSLPSRGLNLEPGTPNYDIKQLVFELRRSACTQTFCLMTRLSSWQVLSRCRWMSFFLQGWKDENGVEVNSGRMNLGGCDSQFASDCLWNQAETRRSSGKSLMNGWTLLKMPLVYRRGTYQRSDTSQCADSLPIWAFWKRLGKYDQVDQLFRHRISTASLGYIGLYEVANRLYGPNWEHNPEAKQFTIDTSWKESARGKNGLTSMITTSLSIRLRQKVWQTASVA